MEPKRVIGVDEMAEYLAKISLPIFMSMAYGIFQIVSLGFGYDARWHTYYVVGGGSLALASLYSYQRTVSHATVVGWIASVGGILGFVIYFYSLFIFFFVGIYSLYEVLDGSSSHWSLLAGIFGVFVGFRMLSQFHLLTEVVNTRHKIA